MASLNSVQIRKALASGKVVQRADDASIAICVRYVGAAGTPSVVLTSATQIAMVDVTASVAYTWANYANMGALADALNASGLWEAKLLDCLRTDITTSRFKVNTTVVPGIDENGVQVWDLLVDNTVLTTPGHFMVASVCLSPYFNFDAPDGHRVHIQQLDYCQNVSAAEAAAVTLWKRKNNGTEVKMYSQVSVDSTGNSTVTSISWASGEGMISGGENEEFILRVQDDTGLTADADNLVRIVGILE
jgi:hypothetical protein